MTRLQAQIAGVITALGIWAVLLFVGWILGEVRVH